MSPRWRDPAAFRADPAATPAERPSRLQATALLVALVLVAGTVAAVSYLVRPERARAFDLFHGSLYLEDSTAPVGIDLTSGKSTVRLTNSDKQVGLSDYANFSIVPLRDTTLLLNQRSGEFNMVDNTGFVVKRTGGGVPLGRRTGSSQSFGVDSGDGQAYIVRTGASGGTDVYLVNQTTVESAVNATKSITPRASMSMPGPASTDPGGSVGADGALWLLTGPPTGTQTVLELSVPPQSNAGAELRSTNHGTVSGPAAALGVAQDAAGQDVVGVLSGSGLQLYGRGAPQRLSVGLPAGVKQILPATNQQGRLAFLVQGASGWSLVSVATDGTGLQREAVNGIPSDAALAQPAYSDGSLYTIGRGDEQPDYSGHIYKVGTDGHATDLASYPLGKAGGHILEGTDFRDAYVVGRGSRVAVDSLNHQNALLLFTDGSHDPVQINKSSAVNLNAQVGVDQLTAPNVSTGNGGTKPSKPGSTKPAQAEQQVNPRIDCKTVQQQPLIPLLNPPVPGSRSAQLSWTYTRLSSQDCFPSTYVVHVKLISNSAPQPPSSFQVQGQTGVNLTGLFPSTTYEVTVTAYINQQSTTSMPLQFTTGPEGPAAPTGLSVAADDAGNWDVTWNACGTVAQGCVATQYWTITPSFCDGRGLSSPPAAITKTADPTARQQGPVTYPGSDGLLGRGLRFQVTGTGTQGQVGTPSATSPCVYSWAPPQIGNGALSASVSGTTSLGGTATADVSLNLGSDPVRAVGGVGATITLTLNGPGYAQSKTVTYDAGTNNPVTSTFTGLQPGQRYSASATVSPPNHPGSVVTLAPVPVTPAAAWPTESQVTVTPTCTYTYILTIATSCHLTITMSGPSSSQAGGETFSLTSNSDVVCGNAGGPQLSANGFDPSKVQITTDLSLFQFSGSCQVSLQLTEDDGGKYFGGTASPAYIGTFTLGGSPKAQLSASDFSAAWVTQNGGSAVQVNNKSSYSDSQLGQLTRNWQETLFAPNGKQCGTDNEQPTTAGIFITPDPNCVGKYGGQSGWTVQLTYVNPDNSSGGPLTVTASGTPPTFQPCTVGSVTAAWGATKQLGITVTADATSKLAGCSNWTYTLTDKTGQICQPITDAAQGKPLPQTFDLTTCGTPPATDWQLTVTWQDMGGTAGTSGPLTMSGTPPTS